MRERRGGRGVGPVRQHEGCVGYDADDVGDSTSGESHVSPTAQLVTSLILLAYGGFVLWIAFGSKK